MTSCVCGEPGSDLDRARVWREWVTWCAWGSTPLIVGCTAGSGCGRGSDSRLYCHTSCGALAAEVSGRTLALRKRTCSSTLFFTFLWFSFTFDDISFLADGLKKLSLLSAILSLNIRTVFVLLLPNIWLWLNGDLPEQSGHSVDLHQSQVELVFYLPSLRFTNRIFALEVLLQFYRLAHWLLERQRLSHALKI